jgi:hypothetical protein
MIGHFSEGQPLLFVTPAKAGVQLSFLGRHEGSWIPAFAGMTGEIA